MAIKILKGVVGGLLGVLYNIGLGFCAALVGGAGHGTSVLLDFADFPPYATLPLWILIGVIAIAKPGRGRALALFVIVLAQYVYIFYGFASGRHSIRDLVSVWRYIPLFAIVSFGYWAAGQILLWHKIVLGLRPLGFMGNSKYRNS